MAPPRSSTRARALLVRPPATPAPGAVRQQLLAMRAADEAELAADERLRQALAARAEIAGRIAACNRALVGTGVRHLADGTSVRIRFPPPLDWRDLLAVAGRPLAVVELRRLLGASGRCTIGDAPKAIANALRSPVRRGVVRRLDRARYLWVGDEPPP